MDGMYIVFHKATTQLIKMMQIGNIPEIPIIGCTAFFKGEAYTRCFKVGMKEVLVKPVFTK